MPKGSAVPKSRFKLPFEFAKSEKKKKDTVLVFADGRQADEAKEAGADIVGGLEMIQGVSRLFPLFLDLP